MYAYEMQICWYSSVKYFVRIKFHFYHGLLLAFVLIFLIGKEALVF
jgi:hypothetical protein